MRLPLTLLADSKYFGGMSNFAEAMVISDLFGPFFNSATFNFYGVATTLADQVMVMILAAEAIDSFAIFSSQYINNILIYQTLQ
jgi:hypothetical protein